MGKRRVTITDISRAAGVSTATVSYFLNGHFGNMSEEVRQRLEGIVKDLGYRPNNLARSLKCKDTKSISLIIPALAGQISFRVVAGVCKTLDEAGYTVSVMISNDDIDKERNYVELSLANQVSGIIVVPAMNHGRTNLQYLRDIHESSVPVVITTRCPDDWPYDGARLDYAKSMHDMMAHFRSKGYKKVALFLDVVNSPHLPFTKELRRAAFLEDTQKYFGIDGAGLIWFGIKTGEDAIRAMREFERQAPESPKAVFSINSPTLGYTLQAAHACQAKIPTELGIGGYGGWDWTFYTEPSLTIMTQPLDRVGETAAELMLRRLRNPSAAPQIILLNSELIPCRSTNLEAGG